MVVCWVWLGGEEEEKVKWTGLCLFRAFVVTVLVFRSFVFGFEVINVK